MGLHVQEASGHVAETSELVQASECSEVYVALVTEFSPFIL